MTLQNYNLKVNNLLFVLLDLLWNLFDFLWFSFIFFSDVNLARGDTL